MKTAWFIGNRKLISSLPWWRQWLVRLALWLADWTCSDEIHGNMITFTKDRAIALASREGWFKLELPVDSELPEEAVNFGDNEDQFPLSDHTYIYHQELVAELQEEHSAVGRLIEQADRIRRKAQTISL